jgi:hypothetical protein
MEFYDKRYQLLKEAVPKVAKLGILISQVFLEKTADGAAMREAARRAGIELEGSEEVRDLLETTFMTHKRHCGARRKCTAPSHGEREHRVIAAYRGSCKTFAMKAEYRMSACSYGCSVAASRFLGFVRAILPLNFTSCCWTVSAAWHRHACVTKEIRSMTAKKTDAEAKSAWLVTWEGTSSGPDDPIAAILNYRLSAGTSCFSPRTRKPIRIPRP